jgi:hypothetical protein
VFVPISSTNTSRLASVVQTTITRQTAFDHSSRSVAPIDLFSAKAKTSQEPPDGRVAETDAHLALHETLRVQDGGSRAFLEVFFKEPLGLPIDFRRPSWHFLGGKRASLAYTLSRIAFDRVEAYTEEVGSAYPINILRSVAPTIFLRRPLE